MSPQQQAQDIRHRMARIRCDLEDDVEGIIRSARTISDWHYYLRAHPWWCISSAVVAGYLIVPRKSKTKRLDDRTLDRLGEEKQRPTGRETESRHKSGLGKTLLATLTSFALRSAVAYLGQQATRYWQQSSAPQEQAPDIQPGVRTE